MQTYHQNTYSGQKLANSDYDGTDANLLSRSDNCFQYPAIRHHIFQLA